jgi:aryl-alcohol dehydrogenase-like predicted oxidoreductase
VYWQRQPDNEPIVARLSEIAARHGLELASLAIAWCLRLPGMSAILTGASSIEQIRANARAAELELTPQLLAELETALAPHTNHDELTLTNPVAA